MTEIAHESAEEEHQLSPRQAAAAVPRAAAARQAPTQNDKAMREDDDRSIRAWFDAWDGDPSVKIRISRLSPKVGPKGENLSGILATEDGFIDEEWLRTNYGGGKYQLMLMSADKTGKHVYRKSTTVEIAGEPRIPSPQLHSDDARKESGASSDIFRAALEPFQQQLATMADENRELRRNLLDAASRPPARDEFKDRVLGSYLEGEGAQVQRLRTEHEDRIRRKDEDHASALKRLEERHADEIRRMQERMDRRDDEHASALKRLEERLAESDRLHAVERTRLEDRHADDMRVQEKRHERELELATKMGNSINETTKQAYEARVEAAKAEVARAERELAAAAARTAALEARKDQTLRQKVDEVKGLQDDLEEMGLGGGGGGEKSTIEKLLETISNSQAAVSLVSRIGAATGAAPASPASNAPPPGVPFSMPNDHRIYVRDEAGHVREISEQQLNELQLAQQAREQALVAQRKRDNLNKLRARKRREAEAAAAAPSPQESNVEPPPREESARSPGKRPSPMEVAVAIKFIESAMDANTPPETLAQSIITMVDVNILRFIEHVGIETFLDGLPDDSRLAQQRGRSFARAMMVRVSELISGPPPGGTPH